MVDRRRSAAAALLALALLTGCTSAQATSPSAVAPATQAAASTPTVEPSADAPLGTVPKDPHSDLVVNPVSYGGTAVVVATFGEAAEGRPVSLQRKTDDGWQEVSRSEQNAKGRAEFHPDADKVTYRAVALDFDGDGKTLTAVATASASAASQWKSVLSEGFGGSSLPYPWAVRFPGLYYQSRWCSASQSSMAHLEGGVLSLGVDEVSSSRTGKVRSNAAASTGTKAAKACPNGVYDNGMVSTEGRFTFTYGTVAVRMKFPYQRGMHTGAWLQTPDGTDVEIDFLETFGYGSKGIQNMLHPKSSSGQRLDVGDYASNVPGVQDRDWWDEYHVASVEWTKKGYVFRLDGVETFRTTKATSKRAHFLVLSLLSSDYETNRLKRNQLPASFDIDWVKVWQER